MPRSKEQRRKYDKEYVQRPEVKQRRKEYYKKYSQRTEFKEQYRNFCDYFFNIAFKSAKRRNKIKLKKPFTITKEYIKEIFPKNRTCPVLSIEFKSNQGTGRFNSASLDRIDNDKGYEIGNVIWVCQKVNQIKTSATPYEIIKVGEFYKKLFEERS
tara:strand:- start:540 stop:1007 length:468 start_codon:yes stop_codon:yes gene_type:complete